MVKPVKDTEARDAFIAEARKTDNPVQTSLFSFDGLKKLSNDELIERIEQVETQALIIKWRIWWTIRQRFRRNVQFGDYVASLRENPNYAHIVDSQQQISRAINAGRFCEKHKITSLEQVGILQSSIYELSKPINEDVADKLYKQIKHKNLPNIEVQRLIAQAKAVETIEQPENNVVDLMPYNQTLPRYIPVVDNVAQLPEVEQNSVIEAKEDSWVVEQQPLYQPEPQAIAENFPVISHAVHGDLIDYDQPDEPVISPQIVATAMQIRMNAIKALPRVKKASQDELIEQAIEFFLQYEGYSKFSLAKASMEVSKRFSAMGYGKG